MVTDGAVIWISAERLFAKFNFAIKDSLPEGAASDSGYSANIRRPYLGVNPLKLARIHLVRRHVQRFHPVTDAKIRKDLQINHEIDLRLGWGRK